MLSERERQIMQIISDNPMVSQDEIAEILGITRSAVSVHILNLVREGVIRGRGYIIADEDYYVVIGAANADFMFQFKDARESSLPSDSRFQDVDFELTYGGIAKNISENLTRLGASPRPIFAVGGGLLGTALLQECRDENIPTEHVLFSGDQKTAVYAEMLYHDGSRQVGLSNFRIEELITPSLLLTKQKLLNRASTIILEDGLPTDTLKFVSTNFPKNRPTLVTTYPERIAKYRDFMHLFSCVQLSGEVALQLAGLSGVPATEESIQEAAHRLFATGMHTALISYGGSSCCLIHNGHGLISKCNEENDGAALYDHYRDSIIASAAILLEAGESEEEILRHVGAVRCITGSTVKFIHKSLCPSLVNTTLDRLSFEFIRFAL